jgi:hypothetical protein
VTPTCGRVDRYRADSTFHSACVVSGTGCVISGSAEEDGPVAGPVERAGGVLGIFVAPRRRFDHSKHADVIGTSVAPVTMMSAVPSRINSHA